MTAMIRIQICMIIVFMKTFKDQMVNGHATACIARLIPRLALSSTGRRRGALAGAVALQIAAIARYFGSLRLARHEMIRTLQTVQLRILG